MVNVIGLGYIGLPTALMLASHGVEVIGTDYNPELVATLNAGKTTFEEKGLDELFANAVKAGIKFTTEYQKTDIYIVSVPTPYDSFSKKIDACYVNAAVKEVMRVCDYVNATHFISKLSKGLDEEVRERGNNFSAGQRQLLSFARTIVHKPSVMILDEATANIDTETELLIQDSLEKMMNIGTMLIVAHRLSTIQHADKIIVLSHGEIVEQGNHDELLKLRGRYYDLYMLQFKKDQLKNT